MPVKRKDLEKCKQESTSGNHFGELSQLDLPAMSLMSLLQFGSGLLLKEAVTQEITSYLGRGHYRHGEKSSRATATAVKRPGSIRRWALSSTTDRSSLMRPISNPNFMYPT